MRRNLPTAAPIGTLELELDGEIINCDLYHLRYELGRKIEDVTTFDPDYRFGSDNIHAVVKARRKPQ